MTLKKEILSQSTGVNIQNANGQPIGKVVEVTFDSSGEQMQYLILGTDHFFGTGNRYFALPVCSELIEVTDKNEIVVHTSDDDLQFAKGVSVNDCPKPSLEFGITIYELFNYENSGKKEPVEAEE